MDTKSWISPQPKHESLPNSWDTQIFFLAKIRGETWKFARKPKSKELFTSLVVFVSSETFSKQHIWKCQQNLKLVIDFDGLTWKNAEFQNF